MAKAAGVKAAQLSKPHGVPVATVASAATRFGDTRWRLFEPAGIDLLPDGRIVVAGGDGIVQLWSDTGEVLRHFDVDGWLQKIAASPDGAMLLVGARQQTPAVVALDLASGEQAVWPGHQGDNAPYVGWSHDGRVAITGDDEGTLRLWSPEGARLTSVSFKPYTIIGVALSPDGKTAFASPGFSLYAIDLPAGTRRKAEKRYIGYGHVMSCSHDGAWVWGAAHHERTATTNQRGPIAPVTAWRISDGVVLQTFDCAVDATCATALPDGDVLCGYADGALRRWRPGQAQPIAVLTGHGATIVAVAASRDGNVAVSTAEDGTVRRWQLALACETSQHSLPHGNLCALAIRGQALHLVYGGNSRIFSSEEGAHTLCTTTICSGDSDTQVVSRQTIEPLRSGYAAAVSAAGHVAIATHGRTGDPDGIIAVHRSNGERLELNTGPRLGYAALPLAWSSAHQLVAIVPGAIAIWDGFDASTAPTQRKIKTPKQGSRLSVSFGGAFAATLDHQGSLNLFELSSGNQRKQWTNVPARTNAFVVAPSGGVIVTGERGLLRIFSTARAAPIATVALPPVPQGDRGSNRVEAITMLDDCTAYVLVNARQFHILDVRSQTITTTTLPSVPTGVWAFDEAQLAIASNDGGVAIIPFACSVNACATAPQPVAVPALPFACSPSYVELVAGALGFDEYENHYAITVEFAAPPSPAQRKKLTSLYTAWSKTVRAAGFRSLGYRSEAAANADGHPVVRVSELTFVGQRATGGASRLHEAQPACLAFVEGLRKLTGITSVTFGAA